MAVFGTPIFAIMKIFCIFAKSKKEDNLTKYYFIAIALK